MVPSVPPGCQPVSAEDKMSGLSDEDVAVSYMGDELDLKTMGDIIAIIEDKVDLRSIVDHLLLFEMWVF